MYRNAGLICRLTDQNGTPTHSNAITYTEIHFPKSSLHPNARFRIATIAIEGYTVIHTFRGYRTVSIPFRILFSLQVPKNGVLYFRTNSFCCFAEPVCAYSCGTVRRVRIGLKIGVEVHLHINDEETASQSTAPYVWISKTVMHSQGTYDCAFFYGEDAGRLLRAAVYEYCVLADGEKRIYTNEDEETQYRSRGILPPERVSYTHVFVNGMLQPSVNYTISDGYLTFLTEDVPPKDVPIVVLFVVICNSRGKIALATSRYFSTAYQEKKWFTDADGWTEYGTQEIPDPDEVSHYNLYVNGILQSPVNYRLQKGLLALTTKDSPPIGAMIVLESLQIYDVNRQLLRIKAQYYSAVSNGHKIYTNQNELSMYGRQGIPDSTQCSYQTVFVNAVPQPGVNYYVQEGILAFQTEDSPTERNPIILQSVRALSDRYGYMGGQYCDQPCYDMRQEGRGFYRLDRRQPYLPISPCWYFCG